MNPGVVAAMVWAIQVPAATIKRELSGAAAVAAEVGVVAAAGIEAEAGAGAGAGVAAEVLPAMAGPGRGRGDGVRGVAARVLKTAGRAIEIGTPVQTNVAPAVGRTRCCSSPAAVVQERQPES